MGYWIPSGVEIYNGNCPVAYTDLDLSAIVGSRRAVCLISAQRTTGTYAAICARPNGEAYTSELSYVGDHGIQFIMLYGLHRNTGIFITGSDGIFEWKDWGGYGAFPIKLVLEGYFVPSMSTPAMVSAAYAIGVPWSAVDASPAVGAARSLAIMRHRRTVVAGGNYEVACRPTGAALPYHASGSGTSSNMGASHGMTSPVTTEIEAMLAITDAAGAYEISSDVGNTQEIYCYAAEIDEWNWVNNIIYSGNPARNIWHTVDTGVVGGGLAICEVAYGPLGVAAGDQKIAFRPGADPRNEWSWLPLYNGSSSYGYATSGYAGVVAVPIDVAGYIDFYPYSSIVGVLDWQITLLGYVGVDLYPPTIHNQIPINLTTELPYFGFELHDDFGIVLASIAMTIDLADGRSYAAMVGGAIQAGFTGQISSSPGANPTFVQIRLTSWPAEIHNGMRISIAVDAANIVGEWLV